MEYYGNRLDNHQVESIVADFMQNRYGTCEREPSPDDIRFALKYYLKRMNEEPNIYVNLNEQGEWIWDIVQEDIHDEAQYDNTN
jgi:hypothetical protein